MSRIIVKNLPKSITEDKIRQIFGEKGQITDVQLKFTAAGKSRQFCFIGYQNDNDGEEAVKHFNDTRINTSKISVENCALLGDSRKPKSWSKYATDSSAYKKDHPKIVEDVVKVKKKKDKKQKNNKLKELLEKYKDEPLFDEFLNVHSKDAQQLIEDLEEQSDDANDIPDNAKKSDKSNNVKANKDRSDNSKDDVHSDKDSQSANSDDNDEEEDKIADKNISDMEYMKLLMAKPEEKKPRQKMEKKPKEVVDLFTVKLKDLPYNCKKKELKHFFKPLVPYSIRLPRNIKGIAYVGFKQEKHFNKALLKDKSIIGGKQISVFKYTKGGINESEETPNVQQNKWKSQEEALKNEEDIAESGRIFIRNLSYTTVEEDIQNLFSKFGPLAEVNLPIDPQTRKLKGFGVITFMMPEHAVKAYAELDGSVLHGRMVHLLPGKAKDAPEEEGGESSNYKQKKTQKQKAQSSSSHNWNALFVGHDAVAQVIANTYGTTKEAVLDPHGDGSAAVRLALGETQIVATTRKYLEEEGVVLDAFNDLKAKRSKTVILVKNLPANTGPKELTQLFEPHGVIGRVIFPPSGISAIIEFMEPSEARKAFTRLAYSKFKNLPLYLEWAPENSLQAKINNIISSQHKTNEIESNTQPILEGNKEDEEEEEEPEPDTTLFVKNLDFKTTDVELRKHFENCGKINYATVALKKDKNRPDEILSMGYGFVRFIHKASADKALKTMQQSHLDGKSLELKRSERTTKNAVQTTRKTNKQTKQTGTKILVKNIPFQAKRSEVLELFKTFGEMKALRLPKKLTPGAEESHRGFAFVDYIVNSDAKKAFEALSQSTHLYGRRLVLEWASTETDVDTIRKRTADHFHPTTEVKSKKGVFDLEKT